jgi:hypothetical protein
MARAFTVLLASSFVAALLGAPCSPTFSSPILAPFCQPLLLGAKLLARPFHACLLFACFFFSLSSWSFFTFFLLLFCRLRSPVSSLLSHLLACSLVTSLVASPCWPFSFLLVLHPSPRPSSLALHIVRPVHDSSSSGFLTWPITTHFLGMTIWGKLSSTFFAQYTTPPRVVFSPGPSQLPWHDNVVNCHPAFPLALHHHHCHHNHNHNHNYHHHHLRAGLLYGGHRYI